MNALCVQELIQYSHENDTKPFEDRDQAILPLLFYDWRGETSRKERISTPAAIKNIEEIYGWFTNYIFGEDESEKHEIEINLTDLVNPLENFGTNRTLSHEDSQKIRTQFRKTVLLD